MTGKEFRAHYKSLGYQTAEIAEELGVCSETIFRIGRRKTVPRVYALAMSWLVSLPGLMKATATVAKARKLTS